MLSLYDFKSVKLTADDRFNTVYLSIQNHSHYTKGTKDNVALRALCVLRGRMRGIKAGGSTMQQAKQHPLSIKDYLAGELESDIRHEFYDGQVYAMAGAGRRHNTISLNIATLLRQNTRGTGCSTFLADMKLYISELNRFYYPDILLSCDESDDHEYYSEKPCLVVEVLSPSTEAIDRREKLHAYQNIPCLQEYVMVSQEEQKVELYRRDGKYWQYFLLDENDILHLECLDIDIKMKEVYEDVFK